MTIYQVVFYNNFGERVADFGFYEDQLDAEKRAFDVRIKTSLESGKVCIEDVFVHDSSQEPERQETKKTTTHQIKAKKCIESYDLKLDEEDS